MSATILGHIANIMFASAYAVRDLFWLRLLSVGGCSMAASFNYFAPESPLWTAIFWNAIFTLVNLVASVSMWTRRRSGAA